MSERTVTPAMTSDIEKSIDIAHIGLLSMPEAAQRLGIAVSRVQQLVRDGHLLATREDGALGVPEDFIDGSAVVKGLAGTITVLRDGGYTDDEILRWLFREDSSLPGTPIGALRSNRGREIKRRAQSMAL